MDDKEQGSSLGEMMGLTKEFLEKAQIIYKKTHRNLIKNAESSESCIESAGFGLACLMLNSKINEWMTVITEEMEILKKEILKEKSH
jgi:hypothetical protein